MGASLDFRAHRRKQRQGAFTAESVEFCVNLIVGRFCIRFLRPTFLAAITILPSGANNRYENQ
jgi:hypothetical protein